MKKTFLFFVAQVFLSSIVLDAKAVCYLDAYAVTFYNAMKANCIEPETYEGIFAMLPIASQTLPGLAHQAAGFAYDRLSGGGGSGFGGGAGSGGGSGGAGGAGAGGGAGAMCEANNTSSSNSDSDTGRNSVGNFLGKTAAQSAAAAATVALTFLGIALLIVSTRILPKVKYPPTDSIIR